MIPAVLVSGICLHAPPGQCLALLCGTLLSLGVGAGCTQVPAEPEPPPTDEDGGAPARPGDAAAPWDSGSAQPDLATARRDPALWPFSSSSPWNMPLGAGAQFAAAASPCSADVRDASVPAWINAAEWSHPVYVARTGDPRVGIYVGGVLRTTINVPANAQRAGPESGGDWHLHIIDPTRRYVDELWQASPRQGGGWNAGRHVRNDLYGSGVEAGGTRAYGGSALGGLIRCQELRTQIPHALALAMPRKNLRPGFVWPATEQDSDAGTSYMGDVPVGQLVAIPPSVDLGSLGLSPTGLRIARALQDYGAYEIDSSGSFALTAEPTCESLLAEARVDMAKIRAQLLCVINNRKDNVGGGGARRAPLAPPLS